jgi:two-component system NtrC family response regulator
LLPLDPAVVVARPARNTEIATIRVPESGVDLEAVERALLIFALQANHGNKTHAARFLRLTRSALLYRLGKHQINHPIATGNDPRQTSSAGFTDVR